MMGLTAYGEPAGPSIVTTHLYRSDSSANATVIPAGGDVVNSLSSFALLLVHKHMRTKTTQTYLGDPLLSRHDAFVVSFTRLMFVGFRS